MELIGRLRKDLEARKMPTRQKIMEGLLKQMLRRFLKKRDDWDDWDEEVDEGNREIPEEWGWTWKEIQ